MFLCHDRGVKPACVGIGSPSCGGHTNFSLRSTFSPIANSLSESWIKPSGLSWLGSSAVMYFEIYFIYCSNFVPPINRNKCPTWVWFGVIWYSSFKSLDRFSLGSDWFISEPMRIFPELIVTFFRFKLVFDLAGAVDGLWRICDRSEVVDGRDGFSSST